MQNISKNVSWLLRCLFLVTPAALFFGSALAAVAATQPPPLDSSTTDNLLAWGGNGSGQLGDGRAPISLAPIQVSGLGAGSGVVALAASGVHSIALKSDGTVLAWGPNGNGQLGDGTTIQRLTPVQVSGLGPGSGVVAIAAGGGGFSLALKSDGTVLAWGLNANGRLGDGTTTQRLTPVPVSGLGAGSGVMAIAAGNGYGLALKADGSVLAWGINANGQLGDGTTLQRLTPVPVTGLGAGSGVAALAASAGTSHSLALKSDGTVLAWGLNATGQLGTDTTAQSLTPVQVSGLEVSSGVVAVAAGGNYSLALRADGSVLAWGANPQGQLGDGTTTNRLTPVQVSGLGSGSGVVALATVNSHSLALKADGAVLAWGGNGVGQLGDGTLESRLAPVPVSALGPGSGVVTIAAGGGHSLAVKADGIVLAWGGNGGGQLGDGTDPVNLALVRVSSLGSGSGIVAAAAGPGHSLAVKADGAVLAWGGNGAGQLGDGSTATRLTPVEVSGLGPGNEIVAVAAGNIHSLALKSDGTVLAWGGNGVGQLGDGTTATRLAPVQVSGLGPGSGVIAVAAGNAHSLALKADGTVVAWGSNANGALGDGTTTSKTAPVQATGLGPGSGVIAVGAGNAHSLALKADGTVLAWGGNANGALGNGTTTPKTAPVQVSGLGPGSGVVRLDAAGAYSLALKADGTVLAWGLNTNGQLGDGTTTQRLTPVQVTGLGPGSGVVALGASAFSLHSLALKSDGTVVAWGANGSAQIGDGTTLQRLTPVQVQHQCDPGGFLTDIVAVAAGGAHSLAITSDQDHDGVRDRTDNCALVANPDQTDTDDDGAGDVCDTDDDNDGAPDLFDACPFEPPQGLDADGNGCTDTITALIEIVEALTLPTGPRTSLVSTLNASQDALDRGHLEAAENALRAFVRKLEAQRGKSLADQEADLLTAFANGLISRF